MCPAGARAVTKAAYHPAADAEVIEAAEWYDSQQAGLGSRFLDEVEALALAYSENSRSICCRGGRYSPAQGAPFSVCDHLPLRAWPGLLIAVMHLHRKPLYWKNRV